MRKLNQKKAIFLATSFLLVFAGGLLSCSNASSNNDNSKDNGEKLYEISGTIAANYSYAPENVLRAENYSSLSRNAITIGDITEGTVTAKEAEVSGSNWTEKSNGRSVTGDITTTSSGQLVFTIKLTNGNWLLGADCGTYATLNSERTQVVIDTSVAGGEQGYKDDIVITVRPKMTASTNGTVNLTITDATGTINTIKAVEIPISSNSSTETDVQTIVQSAADSHTFLFTWNNSTSVPAGAHNVRFDFYTEASANITDTSVPFYSCEEIINVYSNQTTNTWVKNGTVTGGSSIANQKHMTVKTSGAQVTNEANFNLTQECLDLYKRFYYEVSNAAELKAAVEKIILENDSDTATTAANRAEYKIVLANDIVYSSSNSSSLMTFGTSGSEYLNYKYAVALNPDQPLKISIRGKNGLKKLDLNTNAGDSTINKICGIYLNEKVELILGNINIIRAGVNGSSPVAGRGVWRDCKEVSGAWTAGYITLKNKVLITGNVQNIYFSTKTNTGTTAATAPLKIHRSFTTDSRIGLSFADTSSALETPCIVTKGYNNGAGGLFETDTSIDPAKIFFSDSGYNVYRADNEITWNNHGGQGYIDAEMLPEITFAATGNTETDTNTYGGAKYDTNNSRYLIGYKDSSAFIYVVPFMPDFSNEPLLIQPGYNSRDFTLQLEYENGGLVPVGSDPANPTWKTEAYEETLIDPETGEEMDTPVQTGLKFSISATDNTIPTGRYKLVATAKYNGNQYTEYWDLSYVKVLFSLDKTFVKAKSAVTQTINAKVTIDEGELKDVTNNASISSSCKKITGLNEDGSFILNTSNNPSGNYNIDFTATNTSEPCLYFLEVNVNYKGIKCYTDSGTTTEFKTLVSVGDKESFYFIPGCSMQTPLNYDNLQTIINHAQDNNINDYNIYLMGNVVATEETMQETDEGLSFIKINASANPLPINLKIASYGSTVYAINAAGTDYSAGDSTNVLPNASKGRALYIGGSASVTLDKVQIKGGYAHKGSALLVSKGSSVNLVNAYVGDTTTEIVEYFGDYSDFNNFSSFSNGNPGSFIYIDSGNSEGQISTFNCKDTIFNRNMGMIYIGNGTKLSISGTINSTNPEVSTTMFFSNAIQSDSNLINIDGNLQADSYIKGVVFYKNCFTGATSSTQANNPVSIIKTNSNNLLLQNVKMNNNASIFTGGSHFYSSGVLCASNNSHSSVELKDCHFYANNQSINSSTDTGCDFIAVCLRGGTATITDCTFTELSGTNNYAVYTGVTGTNNPASNLQNRINLNGSFYTDGGIYLCKPYASGGGSTIGVRLFIDNTLVLPDADYLAALSGLTYAADPTTFGTIILHADSATPAAGYVDYSQILYGTIQDVKAYYNKFTVKLDDTNGTEKSLNDRGQLEW